MEEVKANMGKVQKSALEVSKWFFDVVTKDGICLIAYAATLRWKGISVPFCSVLVSESEKKSISKSSFKRVEWPEYDDKRIKWFSNSVGVSGVWQQQGDSLKEVLFHSDEGSLGWHCLQSCSDVNVQLSNMKRYTGKGYVEHLLLTVEPWRINIDQLRWGHFFTDSIHMVWIDFMGDDPKRWVWYNGKRFEASVLNDHEIVISQLALTLRLEYSRELEHGQKIATVVKKLLHFLPGFNRIMPDSFLMAKETKWLSKGKLLQNALEQQEGWAVHELVDFTKN